jgi:hypothetical protein
MVTDQLLRERDWVKDQAMFEFYPTESLKKVLFVCEDNSCLSQIAEAFATVHGFVSLSVCLFVFVFFSGQLTGSHLICRLSRIAVFSAGLKASTIDPIAAEVLRGMGVDFSFHQSDDIGKYNPKVHEIFLLVTCTQHR